MAWVTLTTVTGPDNNGRGYYLAGTIQYDNAQDVDNNRTKVRIVPSSGGPGGIYDLDVRDWGLGVNAVSPATGSGSVGGSTAPNFSGGGPIPTTPSSEFWIYHKSDGTAQITAVAWWQATLAGGWFNTGFGSTGPYSSGNLGATSLPTIPRATQPTVSVSSVDAGASVTIGLPRASGSFTHELRWAFGSLSGQSTGFGNASSAGTSTTFTPPASMLAEIPSTLSGVCVITVTTKNGGTTVGSKTVNLTVKVPASGLPDFTIDSIVETVSAVSTALGTTTTFVKRLSKPRVRLTEPTPYQGSSIVLTKVEISGQITNLGSWSSGNRDHTTPNALGVAGTVQVTATVTDARGRSRTRTQNITVKDYEYPTVTAVKFRRALSSGTLDDFGAYLRVDGNKAVTSVNVSGERNAVRYRVDYKASIGASWTIGTVQAPGGLTHTAYYLQAGFPITTAYDVRIVILDAFGQSTVVQGTLSTTAFPISVAPSGEVGIGGIPQTGRALDVAGEVWQTRSSVSRRVLDTADVDIASSSFVPTFTNFTLGNGTINFATLARSGRLLLASFQVTLGSTSAFSGNLGIVLPGTSALQITFGTVWLTDTGTNTHSGLLRNVSGSIGVFSSVPAGSVLQAAAVNGTTPFVWTAGDVFYGSIAVLLA